MNSLAHFQYEARVSLQKYYLPATFSTTMNSRRHDIPYFLRSFARKAKTDSTVEQSIVPQNPDDIISTPSSIPTFSYTASHAYTRRNKFVINSEEQRQHQYVLRKRVKEDTYRLLDTPAFEKHVSSLSSTKEQRETSSNLAASSPSIPEKQVDEMAGSTDNQTTQEEEQKRYKAVMICNTVEKLRQWYYTDYGKKHQQSSQHGLEFSITSYNILAQELLEDNNWLYHHVEPDVLEWDYRCRNLIRELCALHSDIICLQEVQADHYESIFKPNFEALGYECLYKKRTGAKSDGCAVFFRKAMFSLVKCQAVEFNKPGIPLLDRDNVGLILLLRPRGLPASYDTHLCVATTHLLFNPRRGDVKLAQLRLLLAEMDKLAFKKYCSVEKVVKYHPVILCGDMNSEPFSPLYDFLCKGYLNCDSLLSGDISGQTEGANRGRILNTEDLLHPDVAITESSQFVELQKSRQEREFGCTSNDGKQTNWDDILTVNQSTQWPFDSSEVTQLCDTKGHCSESSVQPTYSLSSAPVESSSTLSSVQSFSPSPATIYHYFNFNSAYTHYCGGKHEVTTHHSKANCTVDYIFYSTQKKSQHVNNSTTQEVQIEEGPLHHLAYYRLLNDSEMKALGGLPNSYQSSDHLSLASRFLLKFS